MIAIVNGRVLTVMQGTLEKGTVLLEGGKIKAVGEHIEVPQDAEVIDASGLWVTPGLIDSHTHISTFYEPRTMPMLGTDGNECTSSPITPQIRAFDALNPHDPAVKKVRQAGFTTCCTLPGSGNLIGGVGISFKLRGTTAEEMAIAGTEQMKFALGENPKRAFGSRDMMPKTRMGVAGVLRKTLFDAVQYKQKKAAQETGKYFEEDFVMESLQPVIDGERRVRIHCHRSDDIMTAIRIAEEFKLDYALEHTTEGYLVKDEIGKRQLFCSVGPLLLEPIKQEVWGMQLETPAILVEAGARVCLTADTGSKTAWLPMEVGLLTRRGLSHDNAMQCLTINPAQLLGKADKVGSIEVGKDADIALFDGDPLSNTTLCMMTIIDGVIYKPE